MGLSATNIKLAEAIRKECGEDWRKAHDDPRCQDVAEWVIRSLYLPDAPSAVPLPERDGASGQVIDALCKRFKV